MWNFLENGLAIGDNTLASPDFLAYIATFANPIDPNDLIAELTTRLLPMPLTPGQLINLKWMLIPGLPDFEWTVQYQDYLNNPSDEGMRMSIERKLRNVLLLLVGSSEFHLY